MAAAAVPVASAATAAAPQQEEVKTEAKTEVKTEAPGCPMLLPFHGRESHGCGNVACPSFSVGSGPKVTLKSCPCHDIEYCSKDCQKQHWTEHQVTCTTAKTNADADWMAKVARQPGEKRAAMHGTKVVPSKCLECKRTITVEPDVEYTRLSFFCCRFTRSYLGCFVSLYVPSDWLPIRAASLCGA